ncbi:MAG: Hpt domain-containing protein [Pseudobutyrivibrio ruminis]|nr:Hpt domain-containing protein [Pseudobutyrivibrio ruminis]
MNINDIELSKVEGISIMDGVQYCGSLKDFEKFLDSFYEDIEDNSNVIEEAYKNEDIELFTIKVHALKTSARMIGAKELSEDALTLEMAGKSGNRALIDANISDFLALFRSYKERLQGYMEEKQRLLAIKKPITEAELADAYSALREVCPDMDYEAVEMILEELNTYALPKEDQRLIQVFQKHFHKLEWDEMERLLME